MVKGHSFTSTNFFLILDNALDKCFIVFFWRVLKQKANRIIILHHKLIIFELNLKISNQY